MLIIRATLRNHIRDGYQIGMFCARLFTNAIWQSKPNGESFFFTQQTVAAAFKLLLIY